MAFSLLFRLPRLAVNVALLAMLTGCAASRHHFAGMQAMGSGAYAEAVLELQQAAELSPQDVQYQQDWLRNREIATQKLLAKAEKAKAEGHNTDAEQHYRTILKYDRHNARALAGLEALTEATRAAADAVQARDALKRGDTVEALKWAARSLERVPDQAEARAVKREAELLQAKDTIAVPSLSSLYKKPINLEFRDASVRMVFDALSRTTGINFIFDRDVKGDQRTTIQVKQTTLEDAIDVILTTNQLEKKILNASSVLIYPSTPAKAKEYQDLMVKAFYLSNIEAKTAANLLKSILKLKDIYVDDKYHMIVLRENPETIALAEKLIALQDLEEPEVMLEVEVLEVNRTRLLNLGIQLTNQFMVAPLQSATQSTTGTTGAVNAATQPYKLSDLKSLDSSKLGITLPSATVSLQKIDGDANLLANPRLRVRDREKARILIGDKVPVVTTTTTPNGFLSESIQYLDVGLKLDVEPEIHLRDEISLKLGLEVSSLVGAIKTATGSQAYQIGTRNFSSSLRLKDGETQILAGLISDADRSDANRIPLLGDVPVLGRLFSSQKDDRQKTEIVMSITPHLIRNIQRKGPGAEAFWSGTEANLRTKPVQLRSATVSIMPPAASSGMQDAGSAKSTPASPDVPDASGIKLAWNGPKQGKIGQTVSLELALDSRHALRAVPLQLAFDPAQFEIVSVKEGEFFGKGGKNNFSQVIDKASGRVSVGAASNEAAGVQGGGKLLIVELKPLAAAAEAEISVIGMTPIGSNQAVGKPALPVTHRIAIE
ncbi:MAG TPA: cohesin domain-containing protein [Paucimonas sp.]|nr:cohesin domain-containing protein [Paucimonas sp.]